MKIAVCIKRVPEMDVRFKIAPNGTGVDETGLKWDMSDFDGYAVEAALQMTEKLGAGEVVVVTLGPDAAQETLRKALSMGAARAVHLKADPIPFDNFAIATALASELKGGSYDLILFGKNVDRLVERCRRAHDGRVVRLAVRGRGVEARGRRREGHGAS